MSYHVNDETVALVKEFEGKELSAYRDPVGIVTIGYGYTNNAGFGPGVKMGDVWSEKSADEMLRKGLELFAANIATRITAPANDNEFGAMVSLAYNIGVGAFSRSTCLKRFNAGKRRDAAEALTWFNKADGRRLNGLVRRREAEKALFLSEARASSRIVPDEPRKNPAQSTTNLSVFGSGLAMISSQIEQMKVAVAPIAESLGITSEQGLLLLAGGGLAWIFRERLRKWAEGDR